MAGRSRSKSSNKSTEQDLEGETTGTLFSLDQVKELLKMQESTIKSFLTALMDSTNTRIDNLIKEVESLKTSLEMTQANLDDLKTVNNKPRLESLETRIDELTDKADDLENRSRRNNLCFEGISEDNQGNESWEQSEEKIKKFISTRLKIEADNMVIERAHRVGKKRSTSDKPRPIVAKFLNFKDRDMVLNERRKLKGSKQVIREDFSERVLEKRKNLLPKLYEARQQGKVAYLSFDKLIIRQTRYHQSVPGYHGNPPSIPQNGYMGQPVYFSPMTPMADYRPPRPTFSGALTNTSQADQQEQIQPQQTNEGNE